MVKLNKIYTKTGDDGKTTLVNGERVDKHSSRPSAFGDIDELNSIIGLIKVYSNNVNENILSSIQNDLFDLGADLATSNSERLSLRVTKTQVAEIEKNIDALNINLSPLDSFILPGGTKLGAWYHLARTVARRAERKITKLAKKETINPVIINYINRLSDLLFILARVSNENGKNDVLWVPGQNT